MRMVCMGLYIEWRHNDCADSINVLLRVRLPDFRRNLHWIEDCGQEDAAYCLKWEFSKTKNGYNFRKSHCKENIIKKSTLEEQGKSHAKHDANLITIEIMIR